LFVLGLKKSLISVVILEDHGYDVIFNKGKTFLRHIAIGHVNNTEVCVKNRHNLDFEDCVALSTKEEKLQGRDVGEL